MLGQFEGLPNLDRLEGLRLGLGNNRNEKQIISFTKNPLENSNLLGELFTAISQKQVIELHYHVFSRPDEDLKINFPHINTRNMKAISTNGLTTLSVSRF